MQTQDRGGQEAGPGALSESPVNKKETNKNREAGKKMSLCYILCVETPSKSLSQVLHQCIRALS